MESDRHTVEGIHMRTTSWKMTCFFIVGLAIFLYLLSMPYRMLGNTSSPELAVIFTNLLKYSCFYKDFPYKSVYTGAKAARKKKTKQVSLKLW